MAEFEHEAARTGRMVSEMVEIALRLLVHSQRKQETIPALPKFGGGGMLADVAD